MELKKYKLADIAKTEISGIDKKTIEGEKPVHLCNFVDVYYNWAITKDKAKRFMIASAKQSEIDRFSINKGMVAITKDSETKYDIGVATYIADNFDNVVLGYHCALITPNPTIVDGKYLNAFMHTQYIQKYFENNASGSGQRYTLSNDTISNIPVLLPSMEVQHTIGKLLADLDRKIELNRRINDNLEAMAKQLYDYWFVQFDFPNGEGKPYKSSGGAMVWNEKLKREIPQGWSDCILGEICDMYQPKTLGLNDLSEDSEYKVYGANGIIGHYSSYNHENSEIAMACRGNSCGTINRTSPKSWITGNAMVIKFRNKEIHNEYIKQALKYANVKGAISGSGQPQLTRENLSLLKMTQPNYAILEAFSQKVAAIVAMELEIEEQNDNLTKQRDELLPLLMNGQVSVNYHLSAFICFTIPLQIHFFIII